MLPLRRREVWMVIHTRRWKQRHASLALVRAATWERPSATRASHTLLISLFINGGWNQQRCGGGGGGNWRVLVLHTRDRGTPSLYLAQLLPTLLRVSALA